MKNIFLLFLFTLFSLSTIAQSRYITRPGHISFFSKAPLENIEAHNYQANSIFDIEKGELAFSVLMRGFQFEKALMQEHFNENFIESHIHPRASFTGKILDYEQVNLAEGVENRVSVAGELTIRGITKQITAEGTMQRKGKNIVARSTFPATVSDYEIRIPAVVRNNIAEVVDVTVDILLEPVDH
jgi:hypothetical protein